MAEGLDLGAVADSEKRHRLEKALAMLCEHVYKDAWGSLRFDLKAGLIVNIREERTHDPASSDVVVTE